MDACTRDAKQLPDPDTMQLKDFENPLDAFFWLGYHAGRRPVAQEAAPPAACTPPLCEVAEFCTFDTETSGLSSQDVAVQVAIGFFDEGGRALGFYNKLWKLPRGRKISYGAYKIHKISDRDVRANGLEAKPELHKLNRIFSVMKKRKKRIVAHNKNFDCRILKQSAEQHGVDKWELQPEDVFCTMQNSKVFCGLTSKATGKPKCPSNEELFRILTGASPTAALHDAIEDLKLTARSYIEGARRHWW